MIIFGTHNIKSLLKNERFSKIERFALLKKAKSKQSDELVQMARSRNIRAEVYTDAKYFAQDFYKAGGTKADNHQNAFAIIKEFPYVDLEEMIAGCSEKTSTRILMLDGITDPQNFGSIMRTAAFFGVDGIVIPDRRAVSVTPVVVKVSSGGFLHVPVARVKNLVRAMQTLKEAGFWLYGFSEHAKTTMDQCELADKSVLIIGNEESGIRTETEKNSDELLKLPNSGPQESLNAAVAAAIALTFAHAAAKN